MKRFIARYELRSSTNPRIRVLLAICGLAMLGCDRSSNTPRDGGEVPSEIRFRSSVDEFCDIYGGHEVTIGFAEGAAWDPRSDDLWIGARNDGNVFLDRYGDSDEIDRSHRWKIVCDLFDSELLLENVAHGSYLVPPVVVGDPVAAEKSTSPGGRFWWDLENLDESAEYRIMATFRECGNVLGVRGEEDGEQLFINSGRGMTTVFTIYHAQ